METNDKQNALEIENFPFDKSSEHVEDDEYTPAEQRRIIRKIDLRVTITCGAIYCISLMDRTNLGAASIAG